MAQQAGEEKINIMVPSTGYCYSDVSSSNPHIQPHLVSQLQSFESNPTEIYNSVMWKGYFSKNDTSSHHSLMAAPDSTAWHENKFLVDDSSLRCVFPCEQNERPSQGLSLSLSSSNPSNIGLQSFELRQEDGFLGKSMNIHQEQGMMQDGFVGKSANIYNQGHFLIRNSKYLVPAQQLLNEFCNLGTKQNDHLLTEIKLHKTNQWEDENASSSSKKQPLNSLELLELQKRKTKLLQMLEEVFRRYKHYCDQMKAVVSSFEAVAGNGAATVYSALASKAMSRHFRCLRDGIVGQLKATKKAMGEKDTAAPGGTKGETPRLRLLDQTLRQQRAFQQMSMMESHPWRPQRGLPERSVSVLRAWLFEHFLHPYPSDVDKHILARQTGLSRSQVSNWFINARVRLWKPMVEEMYLEETKELENMGLDSSDGITAVDENVGRQNQNLPTRGEDHKPTAEQLVQFDSESLNSIISDSEKKHVSKNNKSMENEQPHHLNHHHHVSQHSFGRIATDSFGAMELNFSSYNHNSGGGGAYTNETAHHNFGGSSGGVSLTLGLQQHGGSGSGSGVSLAFSPTSQNSLFYPRDHIEDCQTVQYSLLDGEGQNLPYRNLMGAQLLHDLAG